jgi:hypothetical protein
VTDKTPCRTPEGTSATHIPRWKFDACRRALRTVLTEGEHPAKGIAERAAAHLSQQERAELGSVGWHMTTVRLELEVRGEIMRAKGSPVRLSLTSEARL